MTDKIHLLKLTTGEAHAVMRALARSNDQLAREGDTQSAPDIAMGSWVAQRIGRLLDPVYFGEPAEDVSRTIRDALGAVELERDLGALWRLLSERACWYQGALAIDPAGNIVVPYADEATCWCLLGGCQKVTGDGSERAHEREVAMRTALEVAIVEDTTTAPSEWHGPFALDEWNDEPGRTHAEVLAVIELARARATKLADEVLPRLG